ncbi:MAG TPA: MFS transporter [Rhodanobacter sp.]
MAFTCCVIAAGSYFAQPLAAVIGVDLGMRPWSFGLMVTLGQAGYCLGLLLIAPLGDLLENRRLLVILMALSALSLALAGMARAGSVFLLACLGIGVTSTSVQLLVAMATLSAAPQARGNMVGRVTGGLLLGILLAWPVANLVNAWFSWRTLFLGDALLVALLAIVVRRALPCHLPPQGTGYRALLASLWPLWREHAELRRRTAIQALLFGVFSLFWTSAPLWLKARYGLGAGGMALFGLVGAAGAFAAPLAGKLADRGHERAASAAGLIAVIVGCVLVMAGGPVYLPVTGGLLIDAGVQTNHVISQRRILSLQTESAHRLNSLYIALFFLGGAIGSAPAAPLYLHDWRLPAAIGACAGLVALGLWTRSTLRWSAQA